MSTATATDVGKQISDLLAEANQLEHEGQEKLNAAKEKFAAIRDLANQHSGDYQVGSNGSSSVASPAAPRPKTARTRPAASTAVAPAKKKTKSKNAPAAKGKGRKNVRRSGKVDPADRNYGNEISLKAAIWQVLEMGPEAWEKILPDFPADAEGLKVSEVKEIIEAKKIWESSSENISPQIQQHLYNFKKAKKVARGDDRRYYIVEGAELED